MSMRNRCPRGLGVSTSYSSSDLADDDQPDSPGTPDAMVSPHIFDRNAAMEMLHTPKTTRRLRRKKSGPCGAVLKILGGLVALVVVAGGSAAGLVAAGVVKPDAAAAKWAVAAAGRASCKVLGEQRVPGADPCPAAAAAAAADAAEASNKAAEEADDAAALEARAALASEAKARQEMEDRKKQRDAERKAHVKTPPSHVKMLFKNTRDAGDLAVYTLMDGNRADYHSKLAPGEEHTYYIAREQVLEFRHGAKSTADPYWRARVKPFVTMIEDDDDEASPGEMQLGLVFENTMGEHVAVEFAKEGFWLEPKKKTAYNAEEGHAFSLSDVQRAPRFACSVYALSDEELSSLAQKSKERAGHAAAKAKSDAEAAKQNAAFEAAKQREAATKAAAAPVWDSDMAAAEKQNPRYKKGDVVEARGKTVTEYLPGKIKGGPWDDGTYDVDYDDGHKDTRVNPLLIRKVAPKAAPAAPAKAAPAAPAKAAPAAPAKPAPAAPAKPAPAAPAKPAPAAPAKPTPAAPAKPAPAAPAKPAPAAPAKPAPAAPAKPAPAAPAKPAPAAPAKPAPAAPAKPAPAAPAKVPQPAAPKWDAADVAAEKQNPRYKKDDVVEAWGKTVDKYLPGKIRGGPWDDGTYDVNYDDGRKDVRIKPPLIRLK